MFLVYLETKNKNKITIDQNRKQTLIWLRECETQLKVSGMDIYLLIKVGKTILLFVQCSRCLKPFFQNKCSPRLLTPLIQRIFQLTGQQNEKHCVNHHPNTSELISGIQPLIFLQTPFEFTLLQIFCLTFRQNLNLSPSRERWGEETINLVLFLTSLDLSLTRFFLLW